jgi:hypothetical protein
MSAFCMAKFAASWDIFRTVDMDVQVWYHACTYILKQIHMYAEQNYIKMCVFLLSYGPTTSCMDLFMDQLQLANLYGF